jgi:hypothetical protein
MSMVPTITVLHRHRQTLMPAIATRCRRCQMTSLTFSPCRRRQMPSNTVNAITHPCSLLLLSITTVKRHRQCAAINAPPLPLFIAAVKFQHLL